MIHWLVGLVLLVAAPFASLDEIDRLNPDVTIGACGGDALAFLADFTHDGTEYRMIVNVEGTRFILIDFTHKRVWFGTLDGRTMKTELERSIDAAMQAHPNPCTYLYPTPVTIQT